MNAGQDTVFKRRAAGGAHGRGSAQLAGLPGQRLDAAAVRHSARRPGWEPRLGGTSERALCPAVRARVALADSAFAEDPMRQNGRAAVVPAVRAVWAIVRGHGTWLTSCVRPSGNG
jgi:hypothetical protein